MEAVVDAMWGLADECELRGDYGGAVKCLESLVQSGASLLPLTESRLRLRLADILLSRSHNLSHARAHLERAHLLLAPLPAVLPLRLRAHSLLARCYLLSGLAPSHRHVILRALALLSTSSTALHPNDSLLWSANLHAQLASALAMEGDHHAAIAALDTGFSAAVELARPDLQMFFAASVLHVHLLLWDDLAAVAAAATRCSMLWDSLPQHLKEKCVGLFFYHELLQTFYLLRICDYKTASQHVNKLDSAMNDEIQKSQQVAELTSELDAVKRNLGQPNLQCRDRTTLNDKLAQILDNLRALTGSDWVGNKDLAKEKLLLAPPPIDGEWLPRSAVFALVDLMVTMIGRPKGVFKECGRRIQSGMQLIHEELQTLGILDDMTEVDLQPSVIWMVGFYLMILMQFLENKIAVELTRSEYVEALEALVQMANWFIRFPTILQDCESTIEMLRGQYAHSVGCYDEAAYHFLEAANLTASISMQSMCQVYAAVSYICVGDAESSSKALTLVGPVYKMMDSFGVREKTSIVFVYGLLLMRQHNLQEARVRLASGLKIAHQQLGNIQLVSQYLTILGTLALQLHDTGQAKEILKSSLTLAKTLYDIPTQIWVLSVLTALYRELGERANEMENSEYEQKKEDDLQKRLSEAHSSRHHHEMIGHARMRIEQLQGLEIKQATLGSSTRSDLDIPESIGLPAPSPAPVSVRFRGIDSGIRDVGDVACM